MGARPKTHRYLAELLGVPGPPPAKRGREGYTFWERYLAAFLAIDLPVKASVATSFAALGGAPARPGATRPSSGGSAGWIQMPSLPVPASLYAGTDSAVVQTMELVDATLRIRSREQAGSAQFRIEVVASHRVGLPAVVAVRFAVNRGQRLLLVPLAAPLLGQPTAQANLVGLESGVAWDAREPVTVEDVPDWDENVVSESVRAAASEATRRAWREIRDLIGGVLGQIIDRELE